MTIPPNNGYPQDYMNRMNDLAEDSKWVKMAVNGEDCHKALPKPSQNDYMGRLEYVVKIDKCMRLSKLFGKN